MFEFGKNYTLTFCYPEGAESKIVTEENMKAVSVSEDGRIIKFQRESESFIINISSPVFVKGVTES